MTGPGRASVITRAVITGAVITGALGALLLSGCLPPGTPQQPEGWGAVEDRRLTELADDAWLTGSPGEQGHSPYRFARPAVHREGTAAADDDEAEPWQLAATEVADAEAAGWAPVFVRCTSPQGTVLVDLVRELTDSSVTTARLVVGPAPAQGVPPVQVSAVALHHLDGDWVQAPPTSAPADFDAATCLTEPVPDYLPRWSGTPVMFDVEGDSPPAD